MIKEALYKRTTDILFDAYFKDMLVHDDCAACAVGNLVAANMRYVACDTATWKDRSGHKLTPKWVDLFATIGGRQEIREWNLGEALHEIKSTGYGWRQLARIEYAFESANKGTSKEDYMFNGLVAVLEVLKQIHQVTDDEPVVKRFTEHYNTLVK